MTLEFFPEGCLGVYQAKETEENILSGRKRVIQVPSPMKTPCVQRNMGSVGKRGWKEGQREAPRARYYLSSQCLHTELERAD